MIVLMPFDVEYCVDFIFLFSKYVQCWIYEHFPFVVEAITVEDYHERKPCACCWTSGKALPVSTYQKRLDRLTSDGVCWMPYGDHHAIREFELISLFSGHIRWGPVVVMLSYTDQRGLCLCSDYSSTLSGFKIMLRRY